uniref:Uncharacterized protein n=1 Tax=Anguilla anguilla TaxID=7936 RepID=A0A0E9R4J0_ANGAN
MHTTMKLFPVYPVNFCFQLLKNCGS